MFALKEAGERKFEEPGKQFQISLSLVLLVASDTSQVHPNR